MKNNIISYWNPFYWPTRTGLMLLRLIAILPANWRRQLGNILGFLMHKIAKRRRKIANTNIKLCFPLMKNIEFQKLLRENFKATGMGLIETASCWFSNLENQHLNTQLSGQEHLESALAKGKGVILLSFHMTSLEIGGCLLGAYYDMTAMYKPSKNPLIEEAMRAGRMRHLKLLERNNVRGTVKTLKKNGIIWYAADQNYGGKTNVFVPFFDIQTATITATTKLVNMTDAAVVPFTQRRGDKADSYQLTFYPAFEDFPGIDEKHDAARINKFLENYLRKYPVDYMWLHQRFRNRPPGEKSLYS